MRDHRFVFYLAVLLVFVALAVSNKSLGQSEKELAQLYENQRLLSLKKYLDNGEIYDTDWKMFVSALFEPNADSALDMFANVYETSHDKKLREYVAERVAEYYYARGYYKTSERLLKDKKFLNDTVTENNRESESTGNSYGIQIGAFSNYANAAKRKNELLKRLKNVTIVKKESNGNKLYVVVIGKYSNRKTAEKELQVIKRKNNMNGFVIQY